MKPPFSDGSHPTPFTRSAFLTSELQEEAYYSAPQLPKEEVPGAVGDPRWIEWLVVVKNGEECFFDFNDLVAEDFA